MILYFIEIILLMFFLYIAIKETLITRAYNKNEKYWKKLKNKWWSMKKKKRWI